MIELFKRLAKDKTDENGNDNIDKESADTFPIIIAVHAANRFAQGIHGMTTSYDYNAAIRENGALGDKYYEAKAIGQFIRAFEPQLVRSAGGPCKIEGGVKSLFGGVRVATDGTRFVFLHNTDPKKPVKGKARLIPGKLNRQAMRK